MKRLAAQIKRELETQTQEIGHCAFTRMNWSARGQSTWKTGKQRSGNCEGIRIQVEFLQAGAMRHF